MWRTRRRSWRGMVSREAWRDRRPPELLRAPTGSHQMRRICWPATEKTNRRNGEIEQRGGFGKGGDARGIYGGGWQAVSHKN